MICSVFDKRADMEDEKIEVKVSNPRKIGNGLRSYVVYKVTTTTSLPCFMKKTFSVSRRFSDFLGLHDKLVKRHLPLGRMVPPPPEKNAKEMTKLKMFKDKSVLSGDFIENRRVTLERYLNRIVSYPILRADPDFQHFLKTQSNLPVATNTSTLSGASALHLFNRVGDAVVKMRFKMDESEPWFEEKLCQIEILDQQLRKLHSSFEEHANHRKELSKSTASLSQSAATISNSEEHGQFSRAISLLADVEGKIEVLESQQAKYDFYLLPGLLKDYIGLIASLKEAFHQRFKVYQSWHHAQETLTKLREEKQKLESTNKTNRILKVRAEVIEVEAQVEKTQDEFEDISKTILKQVERFEQTRIQDFKTTIAKYVEEILKAHYQAVKCWKAFLTKAKPFT